MRFVNLGLIHVYSINRELHDWGLFTVDFYYYSLKNEINVEHLPADINWLRLFINGVLDMHSIGL